MEVDIEADLNVFNLQEIQSAVFEWNLKKVPYGVHPLKTRLSLFYAYYFQLDEGWLFGNMHDDDRKTHPLLKPYHLLDERVGIAPFLS